MSSPLNYRFADLTLDVGQRRLERGGEPIELGKLTYALLVALVEAAPNVLTHDDLVQRVWGGRATSQETVTQRVKLLRDALRDDAERPRYIGLVRGQGYRLIPPVEMLRESSATVEAVAKSRIAAASDTREIARSPISPISPRLGHPRIAIGAVAAVLVLSIAATTYLRVPRVAVPAAGSDASPRLDFEITQLTSTGKAVFPAISPDGRYVVYVQLDADTRPASLWVRQIGTTRDVRVLEADPGSAVFSPTITPDGSSIDFIKIKFSAAGRELWRVPFLGGRATRLRSAVASAIGWSPDNKQGAFVAFDHADNTSLIAWDSVGEERVLATRTVPAFFVSLNIVGGPPIHPAWSPDGRRIALAEMTDILAPRIVIVDSMTGEETSVPSQGSFVPQGIGWLGSSTLVISQPAEFGQRVQLHKMTLPSGATSPLTNDLSSYLGVELDASRTRLVTTRRDVRTSIHVADAAGGNAVEVVPLTPFGTPNVFLSWSGKRLLYDATFNGRAAIASIVPGRGSSEEIVANAFHVAAAPDGSAIVFSNATRGREGLWRTDAAGLDPVQLVSGFAVEPVVTRDRAVVYVSNRSGVQSPWIVPLDGGEPTEIVPAHAEAVDVSPDGRSLAFLHDGSSFVVCELPRCSNRRELPVPPNYRPPLMRWTPDGKEIAYLDDTMRSIWAAPLDGGAAHEIVTFAPDTSPIVRMAWSSDGGRLAFIRRELAFDIVMLTGLRP